MNVTGTVYRYASASAHSPEPVVLANVHVGETSELALTINNTAAADGYSESMNASIGGATGHATAAGSFNLLAAGTSNSTSLVVGVDTSSAGAKSGTASISLVSDGTGTSELAQTAMAAQTVNVFFRESHIIERMISNPARKRQTFLGNCLCCKQRMIDASKAQIHHQNNWISQ